MYDHVKPCTNLYNHVHHEQPCTIMYKHVQPYTNILKNVEQRQKLELKSVFIGPGKKQKAAWTIADIEIMDDLISSRWILDNFSAPLKPFEL